MLLPDRADMRPEGRTAPPVLRIAGVRAGYGGQSVLRDAGFSLHAGECAALLGPNGSGKTTLKQALRGEGIHYRRALPHGRWCCSGALPIFRG